MIFPPHIPLFGDPTFRGKCPLESVEQMSLVNQIRRVYPDTFGKIVFHPRNEGLVSKGQFSSIAKRKAEGMTKGAPDCIVPGNPSFLCEIKRQNHTLSSWQEGQIEYLTAAQNAGAFVCVALGANASWQAFQTYVEKYYGIQA